MPDNPFNRLAPFIQEYIYQAGWAELRDIQMQATQAILDTPNHVLISSSTASGKTEAAFLPILTDLYNRPSKNIGVIYIGPLKALLNDQFQRLQDLLKQAAIPVQNWHGDVQQSKKTRFLEHAQGILQITPESLEALLMLHQAESTHMFGDLRFIVIDEVHAFIGSDRGQQILCQLQRLARYQSKPPRRIGLSATLGDPQQAMQWLADGTAMPVTLISDSTNRRNVMIGLEYFPELPAAFEKSLKHAQQTGDSAQTVILQRLEKSTQAFFQHLYAMTQQENKTLVFANTRGETEEIAVNLRALAEKDKRPDIYYVHHGSISASQRNTAEIAMKEADRPTCVVATITLELGVDLGQLDQVLQINATPSVSNFVQRLGRSGRRGNSSRMFFYSREIPLDDQTPLEKRLPWNLLQTIAIIQLYLDEKWIEPSETRQLPFSLLYHQTLSCIKASTELTPSELAEQVLTLAPFANVTEEQYRLLLRHLLEIRHLERMETGGLIIGLAGEKIVNDYHFYATFKDEVAYHVRDGSGEVGTVQTAPKQGDRFALAGRTWKVLDIDSKRQVISVEQAEGKANALWLGSVKQLHRRILQRIRQVLQEDTEYGYLQEQAKKRLAEARRIARQHDLMGKQLLLLDDNRYLILPWEGTRTLEAVIMLLKQQGINVSDSGLPFYLEITMPGVAIKEVRQALEQIVLHPPPANSLIATLPRESLEKDKYDTFVPENLLQEAFAANQLDIKAAIDTLRQIVKASERDSSA
ncbi:MAG: DEAD/DEAH box helicase [Chloroflexota bacterium]